MPDWLRKQTVQAFAEDWVCDMRAFCNRQTKISITRPQCIDFVPHTAIAAMSGNSCHKLCVAMQLLTQRVLTDQGKWLRPSHCKLLKTHCMLQQLVTQPAKSGHKPHANALWSGALLDVM